MAIFVKCPSKEFVAKIHKICESNSLVCDAAIKCSVIRIGRSRGFSANHSSSSEVKSTYEGCELISEEDATDAMIYKALGLAAPIEKPKGQRIWGIKDISFGQVFAAFSTRAEARNQARCDSDFKVVRGRFIED